MSEKPMSAEREAELRELTRRRLARGDGKFAVHSPEQVAELLATLDAARLSAQSTAAAEWRPIETAPRDRTWFLWCGDNGEYTRCRHSMAVIRWPEYRECFGDGWWRPLPTPPTAEGEGPSGVDPWDQAVTQFPESRAAYRLAVGLDDEPSPAEGKAPDLDYWKRRAVATSDALDAERAAHKVTKALGEDFLRIATERHEQGIEYWLRWMQRASVAQARVRALESALDAAIQRCNESGTGEAGLIATIHAVHSILRATLFPQEEGNG